MLLAMLAMASYSTVDGIFVDKKLGDDAMKAIVAVWPIFPLFMACSLMLGLGASSMISYYLAKDKKQVARAIFSSIFYFIFPLSIVLGLLLGIYPEKFLLWFAKGLSSHVEQMSIEYLRGIGYGLFGILIHPILDICVINDKRPRFAMFAMFLGAISNIVLNYFFLFIWEFGIIGSAYATVLGHIIGTLVLLVHYIPRESLLQRLEKFRVQCRHSHFQCLVPLFELLRICLDKKGDLYFITTFRLRYILRSCKFGSPYALSEVSVAFIMWLYNRTLQRIGGEDALAVYSAILYSGFGFFTILLALAESIQPIASFNYGLRNFIRLKNLLRFYIVVEIVLALSVYLLFLVFREQIAMAFLQDSLLKAQSIEAMSVYFSGFIFLGANLIIALYLQSLQRPLSAFFVTMSYTLIFLALLLPFMADYYGLQGAYIAYPISQIFALLASIVILFYEIKFGLFQYQKKH
ncbi:hypothetical protein CQA66_00540 [Helicobacter aurati]|uniref:MATE family efflux transporter n=2 Tax=Helicobacter aurati TaxID=137778 RepID=A0A3D8J8T3_9HELI|nr:hypothetical protein CQA66_00540 [Helicobacter aurati]